MPQTLDRQELLDLASGFPEHFQKVVEEQHLTSVKPIYASDIEKILIEFNPALSDPGYRLEFLKAVIVDEPLRRYRDKVELDSPKSQEKFDKAQRFRYASVELMFYYDSLRH